MSENNLGNSTISYIEAGIVEGKFYETDFYESDFRIFLSRSLSRYHTPSGALVNISPAERRL